MQPKYFKRIDDRLVEDIPKPIVKETPFGYAGLEDFREWERRPYYHINESDRDKFKEGERYSDKDFKVRNVAQRSQDGLSWIEKGLFAFHIPKENDEGLKIDKAELKHLELLLGKMGKEFGGKRFCIIPSYINDGCYIATYKDNGEVDKQITGIDIEDALIKIKQQP